MIKMVKYFNRATLGLLAGIFIAVAVVAAPAPAYAQEEEKQSGARICNEGEALDPKNPCIPKDKVPKTEPIPSEQLCQKGQPCGADRILGSNPIIRDYVNPAIVALTALVGVAIVIALVVSGIQYSSARGDSSQIAAAKKRIVNVLIALIAYLFMSGFINWLIPGGII